MVAGYNSHPTELLSTEDVLNLQQSLEIDMKGLVGDAVGNMSISPTSRDVVLAARKGLFIIDLQAPLEVPRFLPQGGTWDVADVQWNPHPSHAEYIVSTSSEKLLIWNLLVVGRTSIEHVLHSHYRAITDINWHTSEPDVVISTGIDSWLWCWDLRDLGNAHKPVFGMCAFNGGGTQVKWNRKDPNLLASSHMKEVLIWDRRKGSLPLLRIKAHEAKIYGIDWAHHSRDEIVTCSLDKTIKVWDAISASGDDHQPKTTIHTKYPVWRARNLPFGHGVLSLPQRGGTALEMYTHDDSSEPIETFKGHSDVVKEFVWRKGEHEGGEFQLITWSKDRTLRFWPVTPEVMEKAGYTPDLRNSSKSADPADDISFRDPPIGNDRSPALSAPVGNRSILAEVRAPPPPRQPYPTVRPDHAIGERLAVYEKSSPAKGPSGPISMPFRIATPAGGTMTRGNLGGRSSRMDAFTWLSSVKVEKRREGSSGPGSGGNSVVVSRVSSRSRPTSRADPAVTRVVSDEWRRSPSHNRMDDSHINQSLQDELTSVLGKLAAHKIRLEKYDLVKKRTCTLGLHGPWGESSFVFIRVTFTFPRGYPQASHPDGTPTVDLERNPLISRKNRAFMLRRLRTIREEQRPCLEACLTFLLSGSEDSHVGVPPAMDSESSSEDEPSSDSRRGRDLAVSLVTHKNLAEPRTSQGVFGPNGELICFFRAPPRIVHNAMRDTSVSPSVASRTTESVPRITPSVGSVVDAIHRLAVAANDRADPLIPGRTEDMDNVLRVMTNLFTFSRQKQKPTPPTQETGNVAGSYSLVSNRLSTIYIKDTSEIVGADKSIAAQYSFAGGSPVEICQKNAATARGRGRYDHERILMSLGVLMQRGDESASNAPDSSYKLVSSLLSRQMFKNIYEELCVDKDIQMLAMLSAMILQACWSSARVDATSLSPRVLLLSPAVSNLQRSPSVDYFNIRRNKHSRSHTLSSSVSARVPSSPITPTLASFSSSMSSKGSWSSLFHTNGMRHLISGGQETAQDGPQSLSQSIMTPGYPIPVPGTPNKLGQDTLRRRGNRHDPPAYPSPTSKSWTETPLSVSRSTSSIPSIGPLRRPTFSQVVKPRITTPKKLLVSKPDDRSRVTKIIPLEPGMLAQLANHISVYAEILFSWQLLHKRAELLSCVSGQVRSNLNFSTEKAESVLGLVHICGTCSRDIIAYKANCSACESRTTVPCCSVCRLPVKRLSYNCPKCRHVTHVTCRASRQSTSCPSGCGCICTNFTKSSMAMPVKPCPAAEVADPRI